MIEIPGWAWNVMVAVFAAGLTYIGRTLSRYTQGVDQRLKDHDERLVDHGERLGKAEVEIIHLQRRAQ